MLEKKEKIYIYIHKRAATEMTQEAPHTEPITCNYSNPGRQRKAADTLCTKDGGLSSSPGSGADA